ncbi:hypothetical protein BHR79_01830 [Methanohalophilus halophilus]|uniref:Uncharacterized protein n=1 Tax=Methanohalophilus halophilus TaxID=2177 RepID=A0A1L3Q0F4_9EURY|nr:hypothetical protein BHR79_01830 [Methanohalophilus halophilus]RNI10783.1 hypothetical protein EFE40_00955 [Methanohalophilus halophilus]
MDLWKNQTHCACNIICCTGPAILLINLSITQAPTEFVDVANIFGSTLTETYKGRYPGCS